MAMAKLTRKLWVGIGAASLVGIAVPSAAIAQDAHKGHQQPAAKGDSPSETAAPGGEAYLTDGGPRDTRIRFYRDVELMRGHLLVGGELIELGLWDEAMPHFLHPTEELYGLLDKYIKLHRIPPFQRELQALAQTVKAKRKGAYQQALAVVQRRLDTAMATARKFMHPPYRFTVQSAVQILRVAQSEYEASIEDGKFKLPVEYQDSRGFVLRAERMIESVAGILGKLDAQALQRLRKDLAQLKTAWPTPMPPAAPVMDPSQISALVSDIELHTSRY
jgi:hypothetical protein